MKTLIEKGVILVLERRKKTEHQTEAIIQETDAKVKLEIVASDQIKVKALKELDYHQAIVETEAQKVKPRIIMKSMIRRKETFFQKEGHLQKHLKPS